MSLRIDPQGAYRLNLRRQEQTRKEQQSVGEKLASGQRINRAADDAAGLALASRLGEELQALEQGLRNLHDGTSLVQTADGGLDAMAGNLHRMRELALTAANGTLGTEQRSALQQEYSMLRAEIDRTSAATEFGGMRLLDGSAGTVGIATGRSGETGAQAISLDLGRNLDAQSLGLGQTALDGGDGQNARLALDEIDRALRSIGDRRAELGAAGNRLIGAQREIAIAAENSYAARSRIMDTDYAQETARQTGLQIRAQAATAVQIQAQGLAGSALSLLR